MTSDSATETARTTSRREAAVLTASWAGIARRAGHGNEHESEPHHPAADPVLTPAERPQCQQGDTRAPYAEHGEVAGLEEQRTVQEGGTGQADEAGEQGDSGRSLDAEEAGTGEDDGRSGHRHEERRELSRKPKDRSRA